MKKTFTYNKIIESVYIPEIDEYENTGEDFKYEVNENRLLEAVVDLSYDDYFKQTELADRVDYAVAVKMGLEEFIKNNDNLDQLVEYYEERLKDYFEEEAFESYE